MEKAVHKSREQVLTGLKSQFVQRSCRGIVRYLEPLFERYGAGIRKRLHPMKCGTKVR